MSESAFPFIVRTLSNRAFLQTDKCGELGDLLLHVSPINIQSKKGEDKSENCLTGVKIGREAEGLVAGSI